MNAEREAKLYMYDTEIAGCEQDDPPLPPTVPAFDAVFTVLKTKVALLHTKAIELDKDLSGNAKGKNEMKEDVAAIFADNAALVSSWAASVNDNELQAEMNLTKAKLTKLADENFGPAIGLIRNRANTNLASLTPYGIVAGTITAMDGLITAWNTIKTKPQAAKGNRKALDAEVKTLFDECDELLEEQLDKTIAAFRVSQPNFYARYFANRNIIDNPTSHTQFKGFIKAGGVPVVGAVIEIPGTDFKAVTGLDGSYTLKCPQVGLKNLKITATGFPVKDIANQLLKLGQTTELDIELEPLP